MAEQPDPQQSQNGRSSADEMEKQFKEYIEELLEAE